MAESDSTRPKKKPLSGAQRKRIMKANGDDRWKSWSTGKSETRIARMKRWRVEVSGQTAKYVSEYKLERGCFDCGYNTDAVALDFDHLPGNEKIQSVAEMVWRGASLDSIKDEIKKCEVVCANCHRIRTWITRKKH